MREYTMTELFDALLQFLRDAGVDEFKDRTRAIRDRLRLDGLVLGDRVVAHISDVAESAEFALRRSSDGPSDDERFGGICGAHGGFEGTVCPVCSGDEPSVDVCEHEYSFDDGRCVKCGALSDVARQFTDACENTPLCALPRGHKGQCTPGHDTPDDDEATHECAAGHRFTNGWGYPRCPTCGEPGRKLQTADESRHDVGAGPDRAEKLTEAVYKVLHDSLVFIGSNISTYGLRGVAHDIVASIDPRAWDSAVPATDDAPVWMALSALMDTVRDVCRDSGPTLEAAINCLRSDLVEYDRVTSPTEGDGA